MNTRCYKYVLRHQLKMVVAQLRWAPWNWFKTFWKDESRSCLTLSKSVPTDMYSLRSDLVLLMTKHKIKSNPSIPQSMSLLSHYWKIKIKTNKKRFAEFTNVWINSDKKTTSEKRNNFAILAQIKWIQGCSTYYWRRGQYPPPSKLVTPGSVDFGERDR